MWMIFHKPSPVGMLTLSSDGTALTGLWLDGQKYFGAGLPNAVKENDLPVFEQASAWLDAYFAKAPSRLCRLWPPRALPPGGVAPAAGDPLRHGHHIRRPGPDAGARGFLPRPRQWRRRGPQPHLHSDPLSPGCGHDGSLTGYAGGVANKQFLLELEGVDMTGLYVPTRGTAL